MIGRASRADRCVLTCFVLMWANAFYSTTFGCGNTGLFSSVTMWTRTCEPSWGWLWRAQYGVFTMWTCMLRVWPLVGVMVGQCWPIATGLCWVGGYPCQEMDWVFLTFEFVIRVPHASWSLHLSRACGILRANCFCRNVNKWLLFTFWCAFKYVAYVQWVEEYIIHYMT